MTTEITTTGAAPAPALVAGGAAQLMKIAQDLGVEGQGGAPPLGMERLPEPDRLLDPSRGARVGYILLAELLFPEDLRPIAAELQGLKECYPDHEASWQLYQNGHKLMQEVADYGLAAGAAHRLVRHRVLHGAVTVLQRTDLPDEERTALSLDLAELQALIDQELKDTQAAREQTGTVKDAVDVQLAELRAEEHLVDVMRRVALREPVGPAELDAAAATYERYLAGEEPDPRGIER